MSGQLDVHHRFLAVRACWTILSGGSVAWKLDLKSGFRALSEPTFIVGCQLNGRPLTLWDLKHADPEAQPE